MIGDDSDEGQTGLCNHTAESPPQTEGFLETVAVPGCLPIAPSVSLSFYASMFQSILLFIYFTATLSRIHRSVFVRYGAC